MTPLTRWNWAEGSSSTPRVTQLSLLEPRRASWPSEAACLTPHSAASFDLSGLFTGLVFVLSSALSTSFFFECLDEKVDKKKRRSVSHCSHSWAREDTFGEEKALLFIGSVNELCYFPCSAGKHNRLLGFVSWAFTCPIKEKTASFQRMIFTRSMRWKRLH